MLRYRFFKVFIPCAIVLIFVAGCRDPKILYPSGDIIIDAGDSIPFSSESYPDAIYKWTFDGGAKDVYEQNPEVRFDNAGVYHVFLTVVFNDLESGLAGLHRLSLIP